MKFEKLSVPTAVHTTNRFKALLKAEAKASGVPNIGMWVTPHPTVGKTMAELRKEAEDVFDSIVEALTRGTDSESEEQEAPGERITIAGDDYADVYDKFNKMFMKERWGDGLPLVPPTEEKIQWMLQGTDRSPDDVVSETRPSGRAATIKAVAINAVMAGAVPAYLPVIIAALEAWDACDWGWGSVTTTSPAAPLMVVNGGISKEIDINSKSNATGYGWRANATIGRALELIFNTVGGTIPGYTDMSIMGCSSTITSTVMAENEDVLDDLGWQKYSEMIGFSAGENVVSVVPAYWGFEEIWIKTNTADELLECLIWELGNRGREAIMDWIGGTWLILCPEHAKILANGGWSKERVRRYLANALPNYYRYPKGKLRKIFKDAYPRASQTVMDLPDNALVSGYSVKESDYKIFVVGGPGNESQNWRVGAPYENEFASRKITLPKNWKKVLEASDIMTMLMPKLPW
ncbi:MAG: hypothetical protein HKM93_17640 [Desulfobacteraceae bacterium]|nr:hypothetical protein [Desulfobacteraceae bacterium]